MAEPYTEAEKYFIELETTNDAICRQHRTKLGLIPDCEDDPEFDDCECASCSFECPFNK